MLYDPKWEKETKANPLTLDGFIAWLEQQPTDGVYRFVNPTECVLAKYIGGFCGGDEQYAIIGHRQYIIQDHPRTFGGALERARAARSMPSPQGTKS